MDTSKKIDFLMRNAQEVISVEELENLIKTKKHPVVYLGTSITGRPHVGYFPWVLKMSDFSKAGFKVKVLLADLHGALDNCPWDLLEKRYEYYTNVISGMFESVGANMDKIEFVKGSDFQLKRDYVLDTLKMSSFATIHDGTKAASEVVKMGENPKISGLIYPIMQALDEVHLDADVQLGGVDQRKIMMFARENLPKLKYERRVEFMLPMIPSLMGGKMSSSHEKGKLDLLDDEKTIKTKMNSAHCVEGVIEDNGILAFSKYVIFTIKSDKNEKFIIERPEKFGGNLEFENYEDLEKAFADKKLHPMDLKNAVAKEINVLLSPIREKMKGKEKLIAEAYPLQK